MTVGESPRRMLALFDLDPIDRVYVDLAARAPQPATAGASMHSPMCYSRIARDDSAPAHALEPELSIVVVSAAADETLFVFSWIGTSEELFSWRI